MIRRALLGALLCVLSASLLSGCGRSGSSPDATSISGLGLTVFAPDDRPELPALSGVTVSGGYVDVDSLRGRVIVVNAWASWCEPCKAELPVLVAAARAAGPDVVFIGLDVKDDLGEAAAMVAEYSIPYESIVDRDAALLLRIPTVPPEAVPSTVIIDRQGRVAARIIGAVKQGTLEPVIAQLLAE